MIRYAFQMFALVAVSLYAWRYGGRAERFGAGILLYMAIAGALFLQILPEGHSYVSVDAGLLFLDSTALAASLYLALSANRIWPLCFAAMQLVSTLGHLLRALDFTMPPLVYAIMIRAPSYAMIAILLVGTIAYRRRSLRTHASRSLPNS